MEKSMSSFLTQKELIPSHLKKSDGRNQRSPVFSTGRPGFESQCIHSFPDYDKTKLDWENFHITSYWTLIFESYSLKGSCS